MPPLEAMFVGTPVIASNVSSIPEIVGDAALLVDPYDYKNIGESILKLEQDGDLRRKMIYKGYKRCSIFSWGVAACETRKIFKSMAKGK